MKTRIIAIFTVVLFLSACDRGEDNCNQVFFAGAAIFNEEVAAVNEAAQNWADDPSPENCSAYRNSVEVYVDRLNDFRRCIPTSEQDEFDSDIEGIEEQVENLDC